MQLHRKVSDKNPDFPIHFSQGPCVAWFLPQPSAQKQTNKKKNAEGFWSLQPDDEQHNLTFQTAAQPSGGELHRF